MGCWDGALGLSFLTADAALGRRTGRSNGAGRWSRSDGSGGGRAAGRVQTIVELGQGGVGAADRPAKPGGDDGGGTLQVMASSSERARHLELFQLHSEEGPCLECFWTGTAVVVEDLAAQRQRWPGFVTFALDAGFASVHALPLRRSDERIGVLGLMGNSPGRLGESDLVAGQTMAELATIAILQQRTMQRALTTTEQLQTALASRIVIEQAKGILSARCGIAVDDSFHQLRNYARAHNRRLHDVAQDLIQGAIPTEAFAAGDVRRARRR